MKRQKRNISMIYLSIVVLSLVFAITSCKDKNKETDRLSQLTKDYCLFQVGSYWVYQSENGDIDSLYLYQRDENIVDNDNRFSESFGLWMTSSYKTVDLFRVGMGPFGGNSQLPGGGGGLSEYWHKEYLGAWGGFFNFIEIADTVGSMSRTYSLEYRQYFNSLTIQDNLHEEVRVYKSNRNIREFYWAKHIGKIRYIDADSTVWELIRYNTIQ